MKRILLSLILLLSFSTLSFAQVGVIPEVKIEPINLKALALKSTVKRVIDHSVSIVLLSDGFGTCSGVLIKNTAHESIVLTAKHCIGTVEELYVEGILANVVGISLYDDLAYIKLNEIIPNKSAAYISQFDPVKGDLVIAIGYPSLSLHVGMGESHLRTKDWQFVKINIIPGCSGGGAFNQYGELVGIAWGNIGNKKEREKNETTIGIFERLEDIINFVKENKLLE